MLDLGVEWILLSTLNSSTCLIFSLKWMIQNTIAGVSEFVNNSRDSIDSLGQYVGPPGGGGGITAGSARVYTLVL